jgi:hypothetical protein
VAVEQTGRTDRRIDGAGSRHSPANTLRCPSCCSTGERNGFTVLTEEEFYDFHLNTPDLTVMLIRVSGCGSWGRRAGAGRLAGG